MRKLFASHQKSFLDQWHPISMRDDYQIIDRVLSDPDFIYELASCFPTTRCGRNRTPVEQTLRMGFIKSHQKLSYRDLEHSLTYDLEARKFCKVSDKPPVFKTIQNQLSRIDENAWKKINNRIIQKAREENKTRGKKLRVDSTVVEANVAYPNDTNLMSDGIRVITRQVKKKDVSTRKGYRTFKRIVKRLLYLKRTIGRKSKEVKRDVTKKMIKVAEHIVQHVKYARDKKVQEFRKALVRIIDQSKQVVDGITSIPNRIVSVFERYARPICRGKAGKSVEFGKLVQIQEDERFITNWEIQRKPSDEAYLSKAFKVHKKIHGRDPNDSAFDRGYDSERNRKTVRRRSKHYVLPKKGKRSSTDPPVSRKEKGLFNWRSGCESTISVGKRRYGLDKCRNRGSNGYHRWVGQACVAMNLVRFAKAE